MLREHGENGAHKIHVIRVRIAQLLRQLHSSWIANDPLGVAAARIVAQRHRKLNAGIRSGDHIDGTRQWKVLHQGVVAVQAGARQIPLRGPIEHEYPFVLMGFHHHGVLVRGALPLQLQRRRIGEKQIRAVPGAAIEIMQHRPAPIALLRWRRGGGEANAERDIIRLRQTG